MPRIAGLLAGVFATFLVAASARAAEYFSLTLGGGQRIDYAVVMPRDLDPTKRYPAILAFPPGNQSKAMVDVGLALYWESEAARRDMIVVSPVAPGALYFQGSEALVPEFLDRVIADLPIDPNAVHLAGVSNGGLSAFRVALQNPDRFRSLNVLPGFPPTRAELNQLDRLAGMTINMWVGENDTQWRQAMTQTSQLLDQLGQTHSFTIVPGAQHIIRAISGPNAAEIFDRLPR